MSKYNKMSVTASILAGALLFSSTAMAQQDERTNRDDIDYEFEFRYDRDEMRDRSDRQAMNRRLNDRADAYCDRMMRERGESEFKDSCRREVVRETRRSLDDDRMARRNAERARRDQRYAARDDD